MYFPGLNGRGGAERLTLELALELSRMGWETFVFTDTAVPAELGDDLGLDLAPVTLVGLADTRPGRWHGRELRRLALTRGHAAAISRFGLDLFINAKYKSQLPGCGRRNVYYCHFPHRLVPEEVSLARRAYLALLRGVERVAIDRNLKGFVATYDEVWANSAFTAGHVERRWGVQPRIVHPPCEQVPALAKQHEIAVVGRLQKPGPGIPYKAQDILVRTFAELTDLHERGWRLVLAGAARPEDQAYLDELRRAADGLPVDILTNVPRSGIRDVVGRAALYWHAQGAGADGARHPETQEHFGISTVEAMSAGAIPLVFGTAGPLEVVTGVEGVEPWRDQDELARLTRLWATRIERGENEVDDVRHRCRRRAAEFDPGHFSQRLRELL